MALKTDCAPYCAADGSGLLIPPLVNGFPDGLRAVLLSGWQRVAYSSARQHLLRKFARCIAQRMVSDCSIFRSPTAFTAICTPQIARRIAHSSARRRQLSPAGSRTIFLSGWQRITHSSARQRQLSPAGSRTLFLSGWQRITHSSAGQRLSRRFARRIAQQMAADTSYLRSSTAFTTVCAPYCSADGSGLLNLPLANSFHDGLHTVLLSGWYRIAPTSSCQWLS